MVILDATSLRLVRTLAFSQVFPSRGQVSARITSLAVDPALKLVGASLPITMRFPLIPALPQVAVSSGPRLAVWSCGVSTRTWLVHSSLILPDDKHITALDCRSGESALLPCPLYHCSPGTGLLAVTTRSTLSVYTLIMENDLPTWSCKWTRRYSILYPRVFYSLVTPHPWHRSTSLHSIYFSPSLVYLAATLEVCVLNNHALLPI